MPSTARLEDIAAPVPELEPPGSRERQYGLRVSVDKEDVENHDNAQSWTERDN